MADAHCPALPPGFKLKTPPFPSKYAEPMTLDANKLKKALKKHLDFAASLHASIADMGVALVALEGPGKNVYAHQNGETVFFGASMMKVAALYGLFELRTTLRAIADELGCNTGPELLKQAANYLNPQYRSYTKAKLPALRGISDKHALPLYGEAFKAVAKADKTYTVDFHQKFAPVPWNGVGAYRPKAYIEKMIAESDNWSAGQCTHACGYGYLAGALTEGGHFDPKTGNQGVGIFLGGDYISDFLDKEKTKPNPASYPSYSVDSVDGGTSQGSSPIALARLLTLLADKQLFGGNAAVNDEMLDVMAKAVANRHVFITRGKDAQSFVVTHTKLGHAPKAGAERYSECSILEHNSGKRFVVVWLNLRWDPDLPYHELDAFSAAINLAIEEYLS